MQLNLTNDDVRRLAEEAALEAALALDFETVDGAVQAALKAARVPEPLRDAIGELINDSLQERIAEAIQKMAPAAIADVIESWAE